MNCNPLPNTIKTSEIVELVAVCLMTLGVLCVIIHRIKTGQGIGARVIQLVTVILVFPVILILALEKALSSETTAALVGAITGYLLSGIGEFRTNPKNKSRIKDEVSGESIE